MKVNSKLKVPKPRKKVFVKRKLHILRRGRRKIKAQQMTKPSGVSSVHEKRRERRPFVVFKRRLSVDWGIVSIVILILLLIGAAIYLIWYYISRPV